MAGPAPACAAVYHLPASFSVDAATFETALARMQDFEAREKELEEKAAEADRLRV